MHPGSERLGRRRVLLGVEAGERFAYFGVLSLLPVHLEASFANATRGVLGQSAAQAGLSAIFGSLPPSALASLVFGLYTAASYVTPLLGAAAADLGLGRRRLIGAGLALSTAGCLLLTLDGALLVALALLALGAGGVKANLMAAFAETSSSTNDDTDSGFSAYLLAVNAGALSGPWLCGWMAQQHGWRTGILVASLGVAASTVLYLLGSASAPARPASRPRPRETTGGPERRLLLLGAVLAPYLLFYVSYNQAFGILPIWASRHADLRLGGGTAPVGWLYVLDGVFTIGAVGAFARITRSARGGARLVVAGCLLGALAYVWLAISSSGARPAPLWALVLFFLALDGGIPFVEVTTLSLLRRLAPLRAEATTLALTSLVFAGASFGAGMLGVLYARLPTPLFWLLHAVPPVLGAVTAAVLSGPLRRARGPPPQAAAAISGAHPV